MTDWIVGFHAVDAVVRREPARVRHLYLQADRRDKRMRALEQLAADQGCSISRIPRADLDELVAGRHQGVAAEVATSGRTTDWKEADLMALVETSQDPLILVLDGVTDPHNLGACLRSADAAGALAVVVPQDGSAALSPVARKVASGAAETVPLVRLTNLVRALKALQQRALWVVGTSGEADQTLYDQDLTGPVAVVMGAEGSGMRRLTTECCDFLIRLPMQGAVTSLNVSVATGICLFEALRQRQMAELQSR